MNGPFERLVNTEKPSAGYGISRNTNLSTGCTENNMNVKRKFIGYIKWLNV
jgi:hypothetical protein